MTTIETFKKMLDWLCANVENVKHQTDVARAAGLNDSTVSRIMKGRVKSVSQTTLRAVNAAYGNVFNPEWMRGESDVMLMADLAPDKEMVSTGTHGTPSPTPPDSSMTAALLASKDETIAALRSQLAEMERTITTKDDVIASKDAHIADLQQQVMGLRTQLTIEKGLLADGISLSELAERQAYPRQTP